MTLPQTFPIAGMTCGSCATKVAERLREHPEITRAEVTADPPEARIMTRSAFSDASLDEWLRPLGRYKVAAEAPAAAPEPKAAQTYRPLVILLGYLLLVMLAAGVAEGGLHLETAMRLFMGGFFVAFSFFKMLDLRGFAEAYRGYDLMAKAAPPYGYVYPFVELALGLGYLSAWQPVLVNGVTAVVMAVSLAGVLRAVLSKHKIRCACLGTVFQLPMSTVTIVEDALMLGMAIASLLVLH
ncbi:MAG TPA: heavy metal-associated domain-containing protein [Prosthecobacter sp.]|nr:heavy metal-associated domain-containing protein [Prosthecobacter sp.]